MPVAADNPHVVVLGGSGIEYEERRPPPQLAPWVAVTWRLRATESRSFRVLPDGCMDLIGGDVVGPFSFAQVIHFEAGDVAGGVRFPPGGLPALLGVPADELVDLRVPIGELVPGFRSLEQLAAEAQAPEPLVRATLA